jgi:tRNA pseudouridine55 synthase
MTLELTEPRTESALDGVLIIDKPAGWTSHDVVAKVRNLLGIRKVGHTGTLDPAATGVLVLCLGKATRIAEYLVADDKAYQATLRLGISTDTQDATGTIVQRWRGPLPEEDVIRGVLRGFIGARRQVPPMYSAVKVDGVRLYKSARAGRTISRPARDCIIHALNILSVAPERAFDDPENGAPGRPDVVDVVFEVVCSKGTYIRTLCADVGEALEVGGHLSRLVRLRVGRFDLTEALSLEELARLVEQDRVSTRMLTLASALENLPAFVLDAASSEAVRHGRRLPSSGILRTHGQWNRGEPVRLQAVDGRLLAIAKTSWSSADTALTHSEPLKIEKVLA